VHYFIGLIYLRQKKYEEAFAEFRKEKELSPDDPRVDALLALAYAEMGNRDEAVRILDKLKRLSALEGHDYLFINIAAIYAAMDERDQALAWLEKAYQVHSSSLTLIMSIHEFQSLRSDPRFQDILRRMSFPP